MKVIFTKTNKVKEVSFGHAVNYLIPRGLAVPATAEKLAKLKSGQLKIEQEQAKQTTENLKKADQFKDKKFTIFAKVGVKGRLFGAITKKEIAEKLKIDKKEIVLAKPIKKSGSHPVELKFGSQKVSVSLIIKEGKK